VGKTLSAWVVTGFSIAIILVLRSAFHGSFWIPIIVYAALVALAALYMYFQYRKANHEVNARDVQ
jgi:hypothetical protein